MVKSVRKENHMAKKIEAIANPKDKLGERSVSSEDYEAIALLAYSYWQARGCPIGSPEEDWYRAENDLRQPMAAASA
jgi:hypothetical protein